MGLNIHIPDPNLRAAIEDALGKPSGATITAGDMQTLTTLSAGTRGIENMVGLEFAINLRILSLYDNKISDVSFLAELKSLTRVVA